MSIFSDLDSMVLRSVSNPPLSTKGSNLTYAELDNHAVRLYDAVQSIVSGENVTAYDAGTVYDMFDTDIRKRFASYNSRIWKAAYVGSPSTFSGQTPEEGIYWEQVTLAQLMPNILRLANFAENLKDGNNPSSTICSHVKLIPSADVLTSYATPINLDVPRLSGQSVVPIAVTASFASTTTPYATNTTIAVRHVGADADLFTLDMLGRTVTDAVSMQQNFTVGAGQTQILNDADLEVYTKTGNPTAGNGILVIRSTYLLG